MEPRAPEPVFFVPLNVVFYLCLISHLLAALFASIQDCDETFNYWEPLHYLNHGYGLQTWEYSPEFGIRSWAYIVIHALPTKLAGLIGRSKVFEFYFLRSLLAAVCAGTETRLYSVLCRNLNPRIGVFYLIMIISSAGVFYASVAFLPSSFAMYTSTLGLTAFIDWRGGPKTPTGIMLFGIGAMLGWPFSGLLILPFVLEEWTMALIVQDTFNTFLRYLDGAGRCLIILALQVVIDTFFYRKLIVVPWRIVSYNVFSGEDRGPNIFGTEAWHFYFRNLLLNFNLWFLFALAAGPLLLLQTLARSHANVKLTTIRIWVLITPLYLWLGVFSLQPHKEERFMYPVYPFLVLNAAIAMHILLSWVGVTDRTRLMGKVPTQVKLIVVASIVTAAVNAGLLRVYGTVSAYRAPLQIYDALNTPNASQLHSTVCFGKDWYRFPTSHFLPNDIHAKFIKSQFDGLLPGEFSEANVGFGLFPGAYLTPSGMNDRNEEDPGKYIDISHCSYLVDTYLPSSKTSVLEPLYVLEKDWEKMKCADFLDPAQTGVLGRMIWMPDLPFLPPKFRRVWGAHCLLKRKTSIGS